MLTPERVARAWASPVHRYCRRMMPSEAEADDAAQEALIKVVRHLDRYDRTRPLAPWVYGIARNTCLDALRRRTHKREDDAVEVIDPAPGALVLVDEAQTAARVRRALVTLPDLYRDVLVLYHYENLKYVEIAESLDVPLGTVMNRIFRARQKMREALEVA